MRNKLIVTLVILFNVNNWTIGQGFNYIVYNNFNCFYLDKDKKVERFRIEKRCNDSVYTYEVGFYDNDEKVGAWFTLDSKLKLVSEYFYYNTDTLYEIDLIKNVLIYKDSLNIFKSRKFSVSEWLFHYDNEDFKPLCKIGKKNIILECFLLVVCILSLMILVLKRFIFLIIKTI